MFGLIIHRTPLLRWFGSVRFSLQAQQVEVKALPSHQPDFLHELLHKKPHAVSASNDAASRLAANSSVDNIGCARSKEVPAGSMSANGAVKRGEGAKSESEKCSGGATREVAALPGSHLLQRASQDGPDTSAPVSAAKLSVSEQLDRDIAVGCTATRGSDDLGPSSDMVIERMDETASPATSSQKNGAANKRPRPPPGAPPPHLVVPVSAKTPPPPPILGSGSAGHEQPSAAARQPPTPAPVVYADVHTRSLTTGSHIRAPDLSSRPSTQHPQDVSQSADQQVARTSDPKAEAESRLQDMPPLPPGPPPLLPLSSPVLSETEGRKSPRGSLAVPPPADKDLVALGRPGSRGGTESAGARMPSGDRAAEPGKRSYLFSVEEQMAMDRSGSVRETPRAATLKPKLQSNARERKTDASSKPKAPAVLANDSHVKTKKVRLINCSLVVKCSPCHLVTLSVDFCNPELFRSSYTAYILALQGASCRCCERCYTCVFVPISESKHRLTARFDRPGTLPACA